MSTPPGIDLENFVANLQDGVTLCTKAGEIVYANQHFARMLGISREQVMTKNIGKDLVDRELEWMALVSLLEQGSVIADYEMRFRRADGVKMCITISATNLRDEKGALLGLAIVARDISTRKGVEDELRDKAFRTDIMNKVAKLTGTTIDVKHVMQPVSEELRKLINFDLLCMSVTEEKGRHVEVLVPDRKVPDSAKVLGKVPFEGSIVEKLKYGRSALIIERDAGRKLFSELTLLDQDNIASFVAVPLMSRGRVLGSLSIVHSKPGEYNWESAESLQMVADQLAGLVDNMILLASLEKKVKLSEMLVKSGVELQKAISTQQVYQAIGTHIGEVVPYKDLSFYLVDWQKGLVFPVHAVGTFTDEVMAAAGDIDEGIVGVVAKSGKAEFVDDVDADPRGADVPGTPYEHNAMLAIPLIGSEGVLSVLELYRERGQVFTTSDLEAGHPLRAAGGGRPADVPARHEAPGRQEGDRDAQRPHVPRHQQLQLRDHELRGDDMAFAGRLPSAQALPREVAAPDQAEREAHRERQEAHQDRRSAGPRTWSLSTSRTCSGRSPRAYRHRPRTSASASSSTCPSRATWSCRPTHSSRSCS